MLSGNDRWDAAQAAQGRAKRFLPILAAIAAMTVAACGGQGADPAGSQSIPVLAVRPPDQGPHPQPASTAPITVSKTNCFALGDPDTIILAPHGSTVLPDGSGFVVEDREFRIGELPIGMSVQVMDPEESPEQWASEQLSACGPKRIAILYPDW